MRELVRGGLLRTEVAPRSLPLAKLAQDGAESGQVPVWDGTRFTPGDVATVADVSDAEARLDAVEDDVDALTLTDVQLGQALEDEVAEREQLQARLADALWQHATGSQTVTSGITFNGDASFSQQVFSTYAYRGGVEVLSASGTYPYYQWPPIIRVATAGVTLTLPTTFYPGMETTIFNLSGGDVTIDAGTKNLVVAGTHTWTLRDGDVLTLVTSTSWDGWMAKSRDDINYEDVFTTGTVNMRGSLTLPGVFAAGTFSGTNPIAEHKSNLIGFYLNGDTQYRSLLSSTALSFGTGSAVQDWTMSRSGIGWMHVVGLQSWTYASFQNILKVYDTDGVTQRFAVDTDGTVKHTLQAGFYATEIGRSSEAFYRWTHDSDGAMRWWASVGVSSAGLKLNAANELEAFGALRMPWIEQQIEDVQDVVDGVEARLNQLRASQVIVDPSGNLSATNAQAALVELQGDIDSLSAGSGIPGSTMDAKGDLIVGTADNAYARRAAPPNAPAAGGIYVPGGDSNQVDGWRTIHIASMQDLEDAIEQFESDKAGFLPRPSSAPPSDGCTITSDTSQVGGSKWLAQTERFKVGTFQCPAATGNLAVTGVGFKPGLVEFTATLTSTSFASMGHGAMDASGNQWHQSAIYGNTPNQRSDYTSTACIAQVQNLGGAVAYYFAAGYVSMDSDGFTINFTAVNTLWRIAWRAYR